MTTITRDREKEAQFVLHAGVGGECAIYNITDIHEDIASLEYVAVFSGNTTFTPTIKRKDNDPHVYLTPALIQAINALAVAHNVIPEREVIG